MNWIISKRRVFCFIILQLFLFSGLMAQMQHQVIWHGKNLNTSAIPVLATDTLDFEKIHLQDRINDTIGQKPWRFGINFDTLIDIKKEGKATAIKSGVLYQLKIACKDAQSVNLFFDEYNLVQGASLFLYNENKDQILGGFTHKNNIPFNALASGFIFDDHIIIELFEPLSDNHSTLILSRITHGYRLMPQKTKGLGSSGACNIDAICPEGDDFRDQIRSAAMIAVGGNGICSGALINNTCKDTTPYFLTANHCIQGDNPANWFFMFNYSSPVCNQVVQGITNQYISGAFTRANSASSDFALLELTSKPPDAYNVYYSGWDSRFFSPSHSFCIHHPDGDQKKITLDGDLAQPDIFLGTQTWKIGAWDLGTTEGGSSGSPLYNQNKHIVGQLLGGEASCSNTLGSDYFGRMDVSWENSPNQNAQLKHWLDGCQTGQLYMDGMAQNTPILSRDLMVKNIELQLIENCEDSVVYRFWVYNHGIDTITHFNTLIFGPLDTLNTLWNDTLYPNTETSLLVAINSIGNTQENFSFFISAQNPNGMADQNPSNNTDSAYYTAPNYDIELDIVFSSDAHASENNWKIIDHNHTVLYQNKPYTDKASGENHLHSICLEKGRCYAIEITDNKGNGLDFGSFIIQTTNNQLVYLLKSLNFGDKTTHTFCLNDAPLQNNPSIWLYNDVSVKTRFAINHFETSTGDVLQIFDLRGSLIHTHQFKDNTKNASLQKRLNQGVYILNYEGINAQFNCKSILVDFE